jgi:uncharacterized protein (TIGR02145 family)
MSQIPAGSRGPLTLYARWGVKDADENVYTTVTIGNQVWTVQNLRTTRYRDGSAMEHITDAGRWSESYPGYCYYENNTDTTFQKKWGALYSCYTVNDERGLAPEGWRVPTDEDWSTLANSLGGDAVAGGKMKEADTVHWGSPNTGATNESGFSALPGGFRTYLGDFYGKGERGCYWSATENDVSSAFAYRYSFLNSLKGMYRGDELKEWGFSVRLVRNVE